jgi:chaperonin GroES
MEVSMDTKIRPLGDRVLVARDKAESKTPGGIVIPENAQEKTQRGEVLAFGPKVEDLRVGDAVLFGKYAGTDVQGDGQELVLLRADDVIAVLSAE